MQGSVTGLSWSGNRQVDAQALPIVPSRAHGRPFRRAERAKFKCLFVRSLRVLGPFDALRPTTRKTSFAGRFSVTHDIDATSIAYGTTNVLS